MASVRKPTVFNPLADALTGQPIAFGDGTSPFIAAWALECSRDGDTGFASGSLGQAQATLYRSGWRVYPDGRVLCPSCVAQG